MKLTSHNLPATSYRRQSVAPLPGPLGLPFAPARTANCVR